MTNKPVVVNQTRLTDTDIVAANATTPSTTTTDVDVDDVDQPHEIEVSSPNFPKPYPGMYSANWRFSI